jgi:hypothetical protein
MTRCRSDGLGRDVYHQILVGCCATACAQAVGDLGRDNDIRRSVFFAPADCGAQPHRAPDAIRVGQAGLLSMDRRLLALPAYWPAHRP